MSHAEQIPAQHQVTLAQTTLAPQHFEPLWVRHVGRHGKLKTTYIVLLSLLVPYY